MIRCSQVSPGVPKVFPGVLRCSQVFPGVPRHSQVFPGLAVKLRWLGCSDTDTGKTPASNWITTTAACMMDLRRYPLDEQNCTLEIESCE
ncbi:hypothetical protein CRUP_015919 [Coryphaenoides rupestris]|nr:hypothetical protein CRUP_015919 [Coryphaenoides rupestris]